MSSHEERNDSGDGVHSSHGSDTGDMTREDDRENPPQPPSPEQPQPNRQTRLRQQPRGRGTSRRGGTGLPDAGDQLQRTTGTVQNTTGTGQVAGTATGAVGGGAKKSDNPLRLRLDLNLELDVELELRARIHGDITLALL